MPNDTELKTKAEEQVHDYFLVNALNKARLAFCVSHGCLTTDRPDLVSVDPEVFWTLDHSKEIKAIDEALALLSSGNFSHYFGFLGPQLRALMSRHIVNPDALRKLDEKQKRSRMGVLYRLYGLYPLYWVMRLLGMRSLYFRIHRRLYMALHHGESLFWR